MLDERAAAIRLGVSVRTVQAWRQTRSDGPPWVKLGARPNGAVRYPADALEQWIRERTHGVAA